MKEINDSLVSIIVPVYNVEEYLPDCIESIINQIYKNIEIILIDDGSPDNSGLICDEYAKKDDRIKVIHKVNEGVSTGRNKGIEAAKGEFIVFVDSDDFLNPDSIEILVNKQAKNDFDFVCGKLKRITNEKSEVPDIITGEYFNENVFESIFDILEVYGIMGPCAKLFKTGIIKENELHFMEDVTFGEDSIFVLEYIEKSKSVAIINNVVYNYNCMNESSASCRYHENFYAYSKKFTDILKRICKKIQYTDEVEYRYKNYCSKKANFVLMHYLKTSPTEIKKCQDIDNALEAYKDEMDISLFQKIYTKKGVRLLMQKRYVKFLKFYRILKIYHKIKSGLKRIISYR